MRLIDADELRKVIDTSLTQYLSRLVDQDDVLEAIDNTSTIDAEPIRHGHWLDALVGDTPVQVCDKCNTFFPLAYTGGGHNYCPNCGAKMDEEEIEDDRERTAD